MLGLMQDWPLLLPQDHRSCRDPARRPRGRHALGRRADPPHHLRRGPRARAAGRASGSSATASGSATASRRWPGTPGGTSRPGTASWASARSTTRVNPRLFPEQIAWIINHAEDRVMFIDLTFVPLLEKHRATSCRRSSAIVILTDARAHAGDRRCTNAVAYEDWIAEADGDFAWATFDENTAAGLCYTSGTTGDPEGRALFAPLQRAARPDGAACRTRMGICVARRRPAGGADVPRQRLGARLLRADGRARSW